MTDDPQQLKVEIALLRGSLFLTARALKGYADSKHTKTEHEGIVQLTVPESIRTKATEALARADKMLKDDGRAR